MLVGDSRPVSQQCVPKELATPVRSLIHFLCSYVIIIVAFRSASEANDIAVSLRQPASANSRYAPIMAASSDVSPSVARLVNDEISCCSDRNNDPAIFVSRLCVTGTDLYECATAPSESSCAQRWAFILRTIGAILANGNNNTDEDV